MRRRVTVWWMQEGRRSGDAQTVFMQDISLTGAGVLASRAVVEGELFVLGLPRNVREPLLVCCEVIRVSELADGIYRIGCPFRNTIERVGRAPADREPEALAA